MRLGYIHIWGKEKMRVSEVTLTHNGNKESVNFTEDPNLEVIDRRKCFFLKGTIQNTCVNLLHFLDLNKQTNKQTNKKTQPITVLIYLFSLNFHTYFCTIILGNLS